MRHNLSAGIPVPGSECHPVAANNAYLAGQRHLQSLTERAGWAVGFRPSVLAHTQEQAMISHLEKHVDDLRVSLRAPAASGIAWSR